MLRAHSLVTGAVALLTGALLFSACSAVDIGAGGEASCTNAIKDGDEQGVDCGGSCTTQCTGAGCTTNDQCASAKCENGVCGAKAGKPCGVGTPVAQCDNGQPCELDKDCKSLTCAGATCLVTPDSPPGPADGKKNNDETDVDCGGAAAPKCDDGKTCAADGDCATGYCPADSKKCTAPRYDDNVKNGKETDVDCGGTGTGMKKCAETKTCLVDTDCNGACNYEKKCIDAPSCKPHLGGDTCGAGELADNADKRESCCRTLPVPGFTDQARPGKAVSLDKYEITAGRLRAFIEDISAKNAGAPNIKGWAAANKPPIWDASWNMFLPSANEGADAIVVPRNPSNNTEAQPWNRDAGLYFQFNGVLFIYVHGHNTNNIASSYGLSTFWQPDAVQAKSASVPRRDAIVNGKIFAAKDYLDVKAATAIPNAIFAAFCHWDGGQLATDEVMDFVTGAPASLGNAAGCGTRCVPLGPAINATADSGQGINLPYYDPYFSDPQPTSEASSKIAAPGRMIGDVVRLNAGDEPWMDLHGNVEETVLDVTGATFTGNFGLKYRGIGYSSSRAAAGGSNLDKIKYPEYKAGYTGGRCMRFK